MVKFIPETHQYFTEDGKELISVTTLMAKHHLSPDYGQVDQDVVKRKAERGTLIHKEIENRIKEGTDSIYPEVDNFVKYMQSNSVPMAKVKSETVVYNDIAAGTIDLIYTEGSNEVIADIKTTYEVHVDSVSWQLSVYDGLRGYKANQGKCFHFGKDGELEVIPIRLKPKEEVEKLFECERNGEIYQRDYSLVLPSEQLAELTKAELIILEAKKRIEEAQEIEKQIVSALQTAMEENAITSFSTDKLSISYIRGYEKKTFDSKTFQKEHPEEYEKYTKQSSVKPTVRISVK